MVASFRAMHKALRFASVASSAFDLTTAQQALILEWNLFTKLSQLPDLSWLTIPAIFWAMSGKSSHWLGKVWMTSRSCTILTAKGPRCNMAGVCFTYSSSLGIHHGEACMLADTWDIVVFAPVAMLLFNHLTCSFRVGFKYMIPVKGKWGTQSAPNPTRLFMSACSTRRVYVLDFCFAMLTSTDTSLEPPKVDACMFLTECSLAIP